MTQSDYELIAQVFQCREPNPGLQHAMWDRLRTGMATALSNANPKFDRDKFLADCKYYKERRP